MKVKELITRLQLLDPEANIYTDYDHGYALEDPIPMPMSVMSKEDINHYYKQVTDPQHTILFMTDGGIGKYELEAWSQRKNPYRWTKEDEDNTLVDISEERVAMLKENDRQVRLLQEQASADSRLND